MNLVLSCDDGCASDIRVAELAKKYKVDCTFYLPVEWHSLAYDNGYQPLSYQGAQYLADEFEIGSHTLTHRHLTKIDRVDAIYEILESKWVLEKLLNCEITKFAPPRGYTNPELTNITLKAYESQRLTRGEGLVHIHPVSGANGNNEWRTWIKILEGNNMPVKELWCHSWELDKYNLWQELEEYLSERN